MIISEWEIYVKDKENYIFITYNTVIEIQYF